jgi:senataxin
VVSLSTIGDAIGEGTGTRSRLYFLFTRLSFSLPATLTHVPRSPPPTHTRADSQLTALKAALEKQPITLIQGPPGTGKTRIILSLLSVILHAVPGVKSGLEIDLRRFLETRDERKPLSPTENASVHRRAAPWMCGASNPRDAPPPPRDAPQIPTPPPEKAEIVGERENRRTKVLVCAPSNSALDEIVLRIMHSGLLGPNGTSYSPTLVRVGVNVHHSVESVSMEALVRERVGEVGDLAAGAAASSEKKFERALEKDRVKLAILDEAAVVCSTLSFSGSGMFARMTSQFDVVVIDEAAQAVEPSTLVPLCYGAKQVFLVGDPRQLPATVLSSIATEHNYNQSLFKRFEQCGYPIHLLKTQYRMHPAIREFPSTRFYAGELEDGPRMAQKTKRPWHDNLLFRPFVFIDVASGKEYRGGGMSWANDEEATLAVALVAVLVKNYPELASGEKIGVISPYKAQVKNIRRKLAEQLGEERARKVDVNSIDGFQGREKDVCIFSVVRAPTSGKGLGFVADERRINVGLTRSKSSLIVLGSAKALKGDDNWGGLVASARDRNLIVKPNGKDLKAFVAKHGAIYDADDLSGSEDDVGAEVADDDDDDDGYGAATGLEHGGDGAGARGVKGHVHRPEWLVSSHLAVEAAEALRRGAGSPALPGVGLDGFAARGVEDELVSEAPNRKVGDDYGAGNDEGDEADPYAQETEAPAKTSARAKRTRAAAATTEKKVPEKKGKAAATAAAAKEDTASPPAAKRTRRGGS